MSEVAGLALQQREVEVGMTLVALPAVANEASPGQLTSGAEAVDSWTRRPAAAEAVLALHEFSSASA